MPLALAALTGCSIGIYVNCPLWVAALLAGSALVVLWIRASRFTPAWASILLAVVALFGWYSLQEQHRLQLREGALGLVPSSSPQLLRGTIEDATRKPWAWRLELKVGQARVEVLGRAALCVRPPVANSQLLIMGRFLRPSERTKSFLARRGACAQFRASELVQERIGRGPSALLSSARRHFSSQILEGVSPRQQAFFHTVVLGDRQPLSPSMREDFSTTGSAHLLSISGLHVSLIAALALVLLRVLGLRALERRWALIAVLGLYALLIGPYVPTLRATVAGVLFFLAPRRGDGWNRLAFALLAVLIWNPLSLQTVGLQLSFGTVAGMLALSPLFRLRTARRNAQSFLSGLWIGPVIAFLASVPLLVIEFGALPLTSLLISLPSVMLLAAILCLSVSGLVVGVPWPAGGENLLGAAEGVAELLGEMIAAAARLPGGYLELNSPSRMAALLAAGCLALGVVAKAAGRPARTPLLLGLLLSLSLCLPRFPRQAGQLLGPSKRGQLRLIAQEGTLLLRFTPGAVVAVRRDRRAPWLRESLAQLGALRLLELDGLRERGPSLRLGPRQRLLFLSESVSLLRVGERRILIAPRVRQRGLARRLLATLQPQVAILGAGLPSSEETLVVSIRDRLELRLELRLGP